MGASPVSRNTSHLGGVSFGGQCQLFCGLYLFLCDFWVAQRVFNKCDDRLAEHFM